MATTDTSEGYVVDIDYPRSFLPVLAPLNLALVALLSGHRPPDVDRPFAYLDLGCGNGFTPALIAATHSHVTVTANDFNPAHVRTARAAPYSTAPCPHVPVLGFVSTHQKIADGTSWRNAV